MEHPVFNLVNNTNYSNADDFRIYQLLGVILRNKSNRILCALESIRKLSYNLTEFLSV